MSWHPNVSALEVAVDCQLEVRIDTEDIGVAVHDPENVDHTALIWESVD